MSFLLIEARGENSSGPTRNRIGTSRIADRPHRITFALLIGDEPQPHIEPRQDGTPHVVPAQAGIQSGAADLGPGLRRGDESPLAEHRR
jgi:hypothetical protein